MKFPFNSNGSSVFLAFWELRYVNEMLMRRWKQLTHPLDANKQRIHTRMLKHKRKTKMKLTKSTIGGTRPTWPPCHVRDWPFSDHVTFVSKIVSTDIQTEGNLMCGTPMKIKLIWRHKMNLTVKWGRHLPAAAMAVSRTSSREEIRIRRNRTSRDWSAVQFSRLLSCLSNLWKCFLFDFFIKKRNSIEVWQRRVRLPSRISGPH